LKSHHQENNIKRITLQLIRILKQKWNAAMILAKFGEVGSTHPSESSVSSDPPPKLHAKTR